MKKNETCTPNAKGALSTECLVSIAKGLGYSGQSAILRILKQSGAMSDVDKTAFLQLSNVGISIPASILSGSDAQKGGGMIDRQTAANHYMAIKDQMRVGVHTRVREAAKWCVVGTSDFDPCNFDKTESGPFPVTCLQQLWRTVGCQAAGSDYPKSGDIFGNTKWGDIAAKFQSQYKSMETGNNAAEQDINVKKCLGIDIARVIPPVCELPAPTLPTFYSKYNFEGPGIQLDVGNYPFTEFIKHIMNDSTSSIRVPAGYSVTAYQDDIGSRNYTYTKDVADLRSTGFDKTISALIIRKTTDAPAPPTPTLTILGNYNQATINGKVYYMITGNATVKTNVPMNVNYFAVGGGGGSGNKNGAGAGGLQTNVNGIAVFPSQYVPGTLTLTPDATYTVAIGAGGSGTNNGGNTTFVGGNITSIIAVGGAFGGATGQYCPANYGGCGGGGCPSKGTQGGSTGTSNKSIVTNAGGGIGGNPKDYWLGGPGIAYAGGTFGAGAPNVQTPFTAPANSGGGGGSGGNGGSGVFILSISG